MAAIAAVATALFVVAAWLTYRDQGWTWISVGMVVGALIGAAGIIESFVVRIELADDDMVVTGLSGRRSYPRREIERVAEARGTAPLLLLRNGRKVKLPSVTPSLGNSVRAWIGAAEVPGGDVPSVGAKDI
jgi:hypothetical protein